MSRNALPQKHRRELVHDVTISILAVISLAIGLEQISGDSERFTWIDGIDLAIVAVFWVDFVVEARRNGGLRYVAAHWWELPSLVPPIPALVAAVPIAGFAPALRLLRLFRVAGILFRLRPAGAYLVRLARRARLDAIFAVGSGVVVAGMFLAYAIEHAANPSMTTLGQAAWFSFNMFTNVAYLDFQPATLGGRILAGILQLCGIAFIGIFTASLAGAIMREPADEKR